MLLNSICGREVFGEKKYISNGLPMTNNEPFKAAYFLPRYVAVERVRDLSKEARSEALSCGLTSARNYSSLKDKLPRRENLLRAVKKFAGYRGRLPLSPTHANVVI